MPPTKETLDFQKGIKDKQARGDGVKSHSEIFLSCSRALLLLLFLILSIFSLAYLATFFNFVPITIILQDFLSENHRGVFFCLSVSILLACVLNFFILSQMDVKTEDRLSFLLSQTQKMNLSTDQKLKDLTVRMTKLDENIKDVFSQQEVNNTIFNYKLQNSLMKIKCRHNELEKRLHSMSIIIDRLSKHDM